MLVNKEVKYVVQQTKKQLKWQVNVCMSKGSLGHVIALALGYMVW